MKIGIAIYFSSTTSSINVYIGFDINSADVIDLMLESENNWKTIHGLLKKFW